MLLQIPDQIPYKQIVKLSIGDVTYDAHTQNLQITLNKQCKDLPEQIDSVIKRKIEDFEWLIQKIEKQSPRNIIIPSISTDNSIWKFVKTITNGLSKNQKSKIHKAQKSKYQCKIIKRFLRIIGEICLKYLYSIANTDQSSLYTFLDERYELYKTDIYQKQEQGISEKFVNHIDTSKKVLAKFITGFFTSKQKSISLQSQINDIVDIENKFIDFMKELRQYEQSLSQISQNFLKIKTQICKKDYKIFEISCKGNFLISYIQLIKAQINNIISRAQIGLQSGLQQQQINKQISSYAKIINQDKNYLNKEIKIVLNQYYKIDTTELITINMQDLCLTK